MPHRADTNQIAQWGIESTAGTGVAATKRLDSFTVEPAINLELTAWRSQGRRLPSVVVPGKEYTDIAISGINDYNQIVYLYNALFGKISSSTHAGGTTSKDWVWTVGLTGALTPQTYTLEKGSAERAGKTVYTFLTGITAKHNRKECPITGTGVGGQYTDNITLTASGSVTPVAQVPIAPNSWVIYSDSTFGSIGSTQQNNWYDASFMWDAAYDLFFPIKSAASFDGPVDMPPKANYTVLVEADAQGMAPLVNARAGSVFYIRDVSTGPIIEGAIPYLHQTDMAVKVAKVDKFRKGDGSVYAIGYELELVEDSSLGGAVKITVTNTIASL